MPMGESGRPTFSEWLESQGYHPDEMSVEDKRPLVEEWEALYAAPDRPSTWGEVAAHEYGKLPETAGRAVGGTAQWMAGLFGQGIQGVLRGLGLPSWIIPVLIAVPVGLIALALYRRR